MKKYCKICKKEFTALKSTITCSKKCSQLNKIKTFTDWERKNKKHRKQYSKQYYLKNKKILNKKRKLSYLKNKKRELELGKIWVKQHIIQRRKQRRKYYNKHKSNIEFKLVHYLRTRIRTVLKNNKKYNYTVKLLGCSVDFLKIWLESKFKPGMTWNNWGTGRNGNGMREWHVDHTRPCASFDLSKESEQCKCFHYTNLQPLWAKENLSKKKG